MGRLYASAIYPYQYTFEGYVTYALLPQVTLCVDPMAHLKAAFGAVIRGLNTIDVWGSTMGMALESLARKRKMAE